ncbi:tRNA pseudouridine(38-40) synthase TruA [Gorillibacterium massiliense]|uniref:tRNA pseudouridine(38-40) synthase TruA n=1 Tax=Gorillibacterium massiliense TaxID=1280390 RepID=UPI000593A38A|nr:tRNA pseudouridine(38-40) synthase TruA [Gorillibacterium massiliense]
MRNLAFVVSYDGSSYNGFQSQPFGNTIQDMLEKAIFELTGEVVKVYGSGRTDAGVHAQAQMVNFYTDAQISVERFSLAMNTRLPKDIVVLRAAVVPDGFHARRHALQKTYQYTIQRTKFPDVFERGYRFHHPLRLDIEAMRTALKYFECTHDFTSFCSVKSAKGSHVRTIMEARLEFEPSPPDWYGEAGVIRIYITGNDFLHNMVRIIVGTLLQVGEGKRKAEEIPAILAAMSRQKAGPTAEAHGLMLWDVQYDLPGITFYS